MTDLQYRPIGPGSRVTGSFSEAKNQGVRWSTRFVVAGISATLWIIGFLAILFTVGRASAFGLVACMLGVLVLASGVGPRIVARFLVDARDVWRFGLGVGMFTGCLLSTVLIFLSVRVLAPRLESLFIPLLLTIAGTALGGALGATPRPRAHEQSPELDTVPRSGEADKAPPG